MSDAYSVKVAGGTAKGKSFDVKTTALVIGTGPGADIIIEGPEVEPRHAQIVFEGGQVMLTDLSAKAGTFRNGKRLLGPIQVFPGDRIGLGPQVILILEGDDPKATAAEEEEIPGAADAEDASGGAAPG